MQPTLCADCGHLYPSHRGCCPYCLVLTAESEMRGCGLPGGELEYINEQGVATVSLPPDIARIRRTATWLLLCSASTASYVLVQWSAGPPGSLMPETEVVKPAWTESPREQRPYTVADRQSNEFETAKRPSLVR